jgi:hypothetical protein
LIAGGQGFLDEDMQQTYGAVPGGGIRINLPYQPHGQFFAGILLAGDTGNPYYGESMDWQELEDSAHLRVTPLEAGIRINLLQASPHRFYSGAAINYTYARERIEGQPSARGWGFGGRLMVGPEWRLSSGRTGLGFEFSLNLGHVVASRAAQHRDIPLTGLQLRGYLCFGI